MKTPVKLARPEDEPALLDLVGHCLDEESVEPADPDKVLAAMRRLIAIDGGIVGVIRGKAGIEATIGLEIEDFWYSSGKHLAKRWLYVAVPHRKSTHARTMLEFAKDYSDQIGVPLIADEIVLPATEKKLELVARQMPVSGKVILYNRRAPPDPARAASG